MALSLAVGACATLPTPPAASHTKTVAIVEVTDPARQLISVDGKRLGTGKAKLVTYLRRHHVTDIRFYSRVKLIFLQRGVCEFYRAFREAGVDILEFRVPTAFNAEGFDWAGAPENEFCPNERQP